MGYPFSTRPLNLATASDPGLGLYMALQPARVAVVEGAAGDRVAEGRPRLLRFADLQRERLFPILKVLQDTDEVFTIQTLSKVKITLRPLTLERYNKRIKSILLPPLKFKTQEAMERHFIENVIGAGEGAPA